MFHGTNGARAVASWMEGLFDECGGEFRPLTPVRQTAEGFLRLFVPVLSPAAETAARTTRAVSRPRAAQ